MRRLEGYSGTAVWAAGCAIGLLVGAMLPAGLLFREPRVTDHAEESDDEQSWACPMLCVVLDSPGTCPVCGMDLEPFSAGGGEVVLDRRDQEMIGLSIATAAARELHSSFDATGIIEFDGTEMYTVTAWTAGRIEKLYDYSTGETVTEGSTILDIYSPELYSAQQELLLLADGGSTLGDRGLSAAGERLELLGVTDGQVREIIRTGEASSVFPVVSPRTGTVTAVHVTEGQHVNRGQELFSVSGMDRVWLTVYLTEDRAGRVEPGQTAEFRLLSLPAARDSGTVETVVPFMNRPGGSSEVRIPLDNGDRRYIPGRTVSVTFTGAKEAPVLSVPRSSVLRLGERSLVYVLTAPTVYPVNRDSTLSIEEVRFEPREVTVGGLMQDDRGSLFYPVLEGLEEGDVVALEGLFLIDSQAELTGLPSLLQPGGRD